jgi:RNA polymerase sigma factor (sigma-70 family)
MTPGTATGLHPSGGVAVEDDRLACRVGRGDEAAFETIVERYRSRLLRYVRPIVGSAGAEDAVQQTLVKAWRSLDGGCEVRDLRGWLFAIAHREALQGRRVAGATPVAIPESLAGGRLPSEHAEEKVETRAILSAIAELPDSEKDALVWTSLQGHSGRDVAVAMGVSEGSVRQLIHRARTRVRQASLAGLPTFGVPGLARWCVRHLGSAPARNARIAGYASSMRTIGIANRLTAVALAGLVTAAPLVALYGSHHGHPIGAAPVVRAGGDEPVTAVQRYAWARLTGRPAQAAERRLAPGASRVEYRSSASGESGVGGIQAVPALHGLPDGVGSNLPVRVAAASGERTVVTTAATSATGASRFLGAQPLSDGDLAPVGIQDAAHALVPPHTGAAIDLPLPIATR